ncbi:MAG: hypothetical protein IJZ35_08985 [Clostridia bacterium]|nr:hypothetical protein [Clostridia bacterium]
MNEISEKYILDALEEYELNLIHSKYEFNDRNTYAADFLLSEMKYRETLDEKQTEEFKEYRHYVLRYISAVKKEYFAAGVLHGINIENHPR